jgi:hypothetical protein
MGPSLSQSSRPLVARVAATVALVAQLVLLVAGLGEGRTGVGYASHIDPAGTSAHYTHNEAACTSCQARSLHGVFGMPSGPAVVPRIHQTAPIEQLESFLGSSIERDNLSRAPPTNSVA